MQVNRHEKPLVVPLIHTMPLLRTVRASGVPIHLFQHNYCRECLISNLQKKCLNKNIPESSDVFSKCNFS